MGDIKDVARTTEEIWIRTIKYETKIKFPILITTPWLHKSVLTLKKYIIKNLGTRAHDIYQLITNMAQKKKYIHRKENNKTKPKQMRNLGKSIWEFPELLL